MSKRDTTKSPVSKDNEVSEELLEEAWDTIRNAADIDNSGNLIYKPASTKSKQ
jgi:hypothetical protein